ncbi:MAG TPA: hypothetical protein VHW66_05970 [Stellaceae bacterium]|nr:hypothetical protein [Stellaceae bacterium]
MAETDAEPSVGQWLGFWVQIVVLGLLAVLGAWFASAGSGPGDYASGLILFVCALALAFHRLKAQLDGDSAGFQEALFVDTMGNLAIVVPLFVVIGLGGLFVAAACGEGSLHDAGIGLFCASGLAVFLSLKRVFDRLDHHP